ncbi:MAG: AI-2E family transporter [Acidobacteria bacterium]|nr:AI-2E family transporter [Acidobacteriota bacterium]MBS1866569.1 AI-2E family transporter [Acidobacteriota bacterium]
MERKQAATALFLSVLATIALYFCFLIIRPFLSPIFLAVMLAIVFHPANVRIQDRLRKPNRAALLSTILVIFAFVVPMVGLGVIVSRETSALYQFLNERSTEHGGWNPYVTHAMEHLLHGAGQYVDVSRFDLRGTVLRWLQQVSQYLFSWGAQVVGNFVSFIANAVIAFFTLFFLFREGATMKERAAEVLPLTRSQVERLFTGISNSVIANVYGVLGVGAAQGALTALGFWVLGLSSPVLWGVVTALFSMVPIIGSAAVWVPAAIILVASGHWIKAMILLSWGAVVVAQADNVIRPYIISQRANLNTLAVFFALLGGVQAFGVMGVFIGPVALSFTLVVLQMLRETILDHPAGTGRVS